VTARLDGADGAVVPPPSPVWSRPKKWTAAAAMPACGREWPVLAML